MTTFEKSKSLWLLGAVTGAVVGGLAGSSVKSAFGGAVLGAILVGAAGDNMLERDQVEQPLLCDYTRRSRLAMR